MENGGSAQVGGTGGEGFLEFTSWRHLDDCENYENIGGEYNQEAAHTSLSVEMMKHVSWLKWVSEQEAEMMAEYSQPKWCMTLDSQKDSSKREHVIVKEHIPPHM